MAGGFKDAVHLEELNAVGQVREFFVRLQKAEKATKLGNAPVTWIGKKTYKRLQAEPRLRVCNARINTGEKQYLATPSATEKRNHHRRREAFAYATAEVGLPMPEATGRVRSTLPSWCRRPSPWPSASNPNS